MSLIADGLLIATCVTMAVYCVVLSSRLRRLTNTEEGIGQQIRQFNAALDETRAAVNEIQGSVRAASDRLMREIGQAKRISADLAARVAEAERTMERAPSAPWRRRVEPDADSVRRTARDEQDGTDIEGSPVSERGEQQLGFLPEPPPGPTDETTRETANGPADADPADVPMPVTKAEGDREPTPMDLLKVERMAL